MNAHTRDPRLHYLADLDGKVWPGTDPARLKRLVRLENDRIRIEHVSEDETGPMRFLNFFRVRERDLIAEPAGTLARCVSRGETALIQSEGYLTAEPGAVVAAIVPMRDFLTMLSDINKFK